MIPYLQRVLACLITEQLPTRRCDPCRPRSFVCKVDIWMRELQANAKSHFLCGPTRQAQSHRTAAKNLKVQFSTEIPRENGTAWKKVVGAQFVLLLQNHQQKQTILPNQFIFQGPCHLETEQFCRAMRTNCKIVRESDTVWYWKWTPELKQGWARRRDTGNEKFYECSQKVAILGTQLRFLPRPVLVVLWANSCQFGKHESSNRRHL